MPCAVDGCDKPIRSLGYCGMHLQRLRRHGDALRERRRDFTKSPLYPTWKMLRRKATVCEEWVQSFEVFERTCPRMPDSENSWTLCAINPTMKIGPLNAEWKFRHKRGTWTDKQKDAAKYRQRAYRLAHPDRVKNTILKRHYGITIGDYMRMHNDQNGLCAICKKPETTVIRGKEVSLSVDHCHSTGAVRGLLCRPCNQAIGSMKHDRSILLAAIDYLDKSEALTSGRE